MLVPGNTHDTYNWELLGEESQLCIRLNIIHINLLSHKIYKKAAFWSCILSKYYQILSQNDNYCNTVVMHSYTICLCERWGCDCVCDCVSQHTSVSWGMWLCVSVCHCVLVCVTVCSRVCVWRGGCVTVCVGVSLHTSVCRGCDCVCHCEHVCTYSCTVEPVLRDHPICHWNVVSQDRWSFPTVVSQDRFHCISTVCQPFSTCTGIYIWQLVQWSQCIHLDKMCIFIILLELCWFHFRNF